MDATLARGDAALQQRGPHPLPLFLELALSVTGGERERMARVLAGVRAYQEHPWRREPTAAREAARAGACRLMDLGGAGPPVVLVPSLINGPEVLDLAPEISLAARLRAGGLRPFLVEWGVPGADERALTLGGFVTQRLLPLLDAVGSARVVGYCLGGTIALAAAALRPPERLALIAAPWRASGYPRDRRDALARLWSALAPGAAAAGAVPVELLQPGFWSLDPERTVAKYERFAALAADDPAARRYVEVEDWANGGPPLPAGAARDLFETFYRDDALGLGLWRVDSRAVDPAAIGCPVLNVVAGRDRIVPADAAPCVGERWLIDGGHVGMMVGGRARALLHDPLARWLAG